MIKKGVYYSPRMDKIIIISKPHTFKLKSGDYCSLVTWEQEGCIYPKTLIEGTNLIKYNFWWVGEL